MASYTIAAAERGAYEKALVANTEDTVTFANDQSTVEVKVLSGGPVYFTTDNAAATVKGAQCFDAQGNTAVKVQTTNGPRIAGATIVRLISGSASVYSVSSA